MSYHKRKKTSFSFNKNWRGALVVVGAMLIFFVIRSIAFSRPFYSDVASRFFSSKRTLVSEVTALKLEEEKMQSDEALIAVLKDENEKLKTELGRTNRATHGVLATVLFPPGRSLYDTFTIDAGSIAGISEGQGVYAFGDVALGTVTHVTPTTATVLLYSDAGRETAGTVIGTDTAVTLIGRGAGEYEIRMPRDAHFDVGQTITLQSTAPRIFATIEKISTDPRDPFQRLLAKAPVNLQNLKWVLVE